MRNIHNKNVKYLTQTSLTYEDPEIIPLYWSCTDESCNGYTCPGGLIKPCSHFPDDFSCGNVRSISILDAWLKCPLLNKLRRLYTLSEPCNSCPLLGVTCGGGCRAIAANVFHNLTGIDFNICSKTRDFYDKCYTRL